MSRRRRGERAKVWWNAEEGKVHEILLEYAHEVERRQTDYFDRFQMLESMYDPNGPAAQLADPKWRRDLGRITENVIASTVDTVRSAISATEVRARFPTDGADWSVQRRSALLEKYAEELSKRLGVGEACRMAFFGGAKKGTGLVKVAADQDGQIHVDPILIDNVIVDDLECQNGGRPRQLHYRQIDYDRDLLIQQFPEKAEEIEKLAPAGSGQRTRFTRWTLPGQKTRNNLFVIESWRLPMGVPDTDGYVPGRHAICTEGLDLLDEEWHKPRFPIAEFRWAERESSWYGISLSERIVGHQRTLNKRNWQRDRQLDLIAVPTTYVRPADAALRVQTTQIGNVVAIKGDYPHTIVPQAVGAEVLADRHDAKASALEETGVSRMSAYAVKPPGIDSGVGLREHKDQATQRFSQQEKGYEELWLDVVVLILDACRDLDGDAPEMSRQTRYGKRRIPWGDVSMDDVHAMIAASSTLNRTPSGRVQTVLELAQAGVISMDEARRLLQNPDLEQALSLYTAALEAIEEDLEMIRDGHSVIPEPFINLKMAVWRGQASYLIDRGRGAPERVLEAMYTYVIQAADVLSKQETSAAPMAGQPLAPPGVMPQQVPAAGPPILPPGGAAILPAGA